MILWKIITGIVAFATPCLISWEMCTVLSTFSFTSSVIYAFSPAPAAVAKTKKKRKKPEVFPCPRLEGI